MVSRRPHRKSRLGCTTCKQRRVKCDEAGPPCGPCAARSIECRYAQATISARKSSPASDKTNGSSMMMMAAGNSTRLRELELLHQWTSTTYKSYCGTVEEEYFNWQVFIPKLALKHDYLLHGLFAMSALEIGAFSETNLSQDYIDTALEYQNSASSRLREEIMITDLATVSQEKHQALWALSSILMVLALAIPPYTLRTEKYDMIDHIMTFIELMKGFILIVVNRIRSHKDDPLLCKYKEWHELENKPIAPEFQAAFERLKTLNEEIHGAATQEKERTSELKSMTYHAACRKAIFHLEECWEKCSEPDTRAYGLAWVLFSGEEYLAAIKDKEPLALLILMHWGMFLEMQSYGVWYVQKVGKFLVEDLSDGLPLLGNARMEEAVVWVRKQVGLD